MAAPSPQPLSSDETSLLELQKSLEEQEISYCGASGAPPAVYSKLMALYLLKDDLTSCKFLWKRISSSIKSENSELSMLWQVFSKLWERDTVAAFAALNVEWPEHLKPLTTLLVDRLREKSFNLVSFAYTSIALKQVASMVALSVDDTVIEATNRGWRIDLATEMLFPIKPECSNKQVMPDEEYLHRLTGNVAFLEN